jgi:hypothetical protein
MSLTTIILINAIADVTILGTLAFACTRAAGLRPHPRSLARPRSARRAVYRAVGAAN